MGRARGTPTGSEEPQALGNLTVQVEGALEYEYEVEANLDKFIVNPNQTIEKSDSRINGGWPMRSDQRQSHVHIV